MEVFIFDTGDQEFLEWMRLNPSGFILNTGKLEESKFLMMHRSGCFHISGSLADQSENAFTKEGNIKVASLKASRLFEWAKDHRPMESDVATCKTCQPSHRAHRIGMTRVSDPSAVMEAIGEFDELGRDGFLKKYGFGKARSYFLFNSGKRYDSKAIYAAARGKQFPNLGPLKAVEFSGGEKTVAHKLRSLGFEVTKHGYDPRAPKTWAFEPGKRYNRRKDIHQRLGGQAYGGMSTPAGHPVILLFAGEAGVEHGYRDEFKADGTYWYTGEGQRGDMEFVRSNLALLHHQENEKRVFLFEGLGDGMVRHVGEVEYLGHHTEERPDTDGKPREAIVFELALVAYEPGIESQTVNDSEGNQAGQNLSKKTLAQLRALALKGAGDGKNAQQRRQNVYVRSEAVRKYVLKRAAGFCEGCEKEAPFKTKKRRPYLEPHHTTRIADGGPDHPAHVISLCPTCHRRAHYAHDGDEYNTELIDRLRTIEEAV